MLFSDTNASEDIIIEDIEIESPKIIVSDEDEVTASKILARERTGVVTKKYQQNPDTRKNLKTNEMRISKASEDIITEVTENTELPKIIISDADKLIAPNKLEREKTSAVTKRYQLKSNTRKDLEINQIDRISQPTGACLPPDMQKFHGELKKYIKLNILNIIISCLYIPENIARFYIIYFQLKCKDYGSFDENLCVFQVIVMIFYPYFVKKKLEKLK